MPTEEEALDRLEEAIEALLASRGEPGLLLDWVLVTHKIQVRDDGTNLSSTGYTGAGQQTRYRTLGLLEYALRVVQTEIQEDMKGED